MKLFLADPADPGGANRPIEVGTSAELCLLRTSIDELLGAPSRELVRGTYGRAGWREAG